MPDSNQIIGATIQVETGNSNANVQQLNKSLSDVKGNLRETGGAANEAGKLVEGTGGSFGKLKEQMSALPGPLGEAGEGVGKLGTAFKALLANPVVLIITAIVGALALLYKAFTNTFEGGEKVEQIFAGIKAAAQALFDNIGHIASAIVKFFSFDFSGAIAEIKGVVNSVADAYSAMARLTQQAQELHKEQLTADLEQAKRQKDLAILREQATDESIPVAKRKAALLELQKVSKEAADEEIGLAKKITDNKIAQLTLQKDGELKNRDEINQLRIDEINKETDAANEQRRIGRQVTQAQKQELAEQKAEAAKAAQEQKALRQELVDYTNKLLKIQQDTELAQITDTYEKEKKQLEIKIASDKQQNDLAFEDKKITAAQHATLELALAAQAQAQRQQLEDKHNTETAAKEAAFQKDLAAIIAKTKEDSNTDARAAEKLKLQAEHDQRIADAEKTYKDDATKLFAIKQALNEQFRVQQEKIDEKNRLDDEKKLTTQQVEAAKLVQNNLKASFAARLQAIDAEQALFKKQFDDKIITEQDYNNKVQGLADARVNIQKSENEARLAIEQDIADAFGNLATIAGKQTQVGKDLAVIQATISTIVSAQKAYESLAVVPVIGPALGVIAAAAAVASGVANVKKILAVQVPGQGGGGAAPSIGSTAAAAPAAPIAPVQRSTAINEASANAIGNATSGRAYVLQSDVQNNAELAARLERAAKLGG